ncbi:DNA glycosylase, partial [Wilcoxina mikolae CBS 423.85]
PPNFTTTTATILNDAQAHLISYAPSLAALIEEHPCNLFTPAGLSEVIDPFESLTSALISQQITGAAAKSIKAKFISLFSAELSRLGITFPIPAMVLAIDIPTLRTAGLSERKAGYIHSLCEAFESGEVSAEFFAAAGDEEVIERLTKVRGIGVWSAEMFLMFGLRRMDVFSTGDLGIQRGMAAFVGRNVKALKTSGKGKWKYMDEKEMLEISEKFRPYRSLFCWYMWRFEGTGL